MNSTNVRTLTLSSFLFLLVMFTGCKKEFTSSAGSSQKAVQSESNEAAQITVNVKDYGAKGDGVTDNVDAFQAAEDFVSSKGGGTVYVPAGVYIVSKAFYHRNFVTLTGDGDKSIIRNKVSSPQGPDQFCIYIGNFAPSTYAECVHYDGYGIYSGSTQLKLKSSSNASSFFVGQAVLVDSKSGFMSDDGHWKPYVALINRVKAIDVNNGIITLEDGVTTNIPDVQIAPTNKFISGIKNDTSKVYICQKPVIKNIRFESLGDWTMRFGVYKGWFENISVKTTDVIGGNGFSYCTFKNIRAEFSQKVIEMAMYSHNSTVDGLTATWYDGAIDSAMKPLLKMGENQRDCSYSNLTINSGKGKYFGMCMRFEHAFNNKIFNCYFQCPTIAQDGVELSASGDDSRVTGNEVSNNSFVLGNTDYYIKVENTYSGAIVNGNKVTGNTFSGTIRKKYVVIKTSENNTIQSNTYLK